MNANELDEWIDNSPYTEKEEVIRLLRQQAAEIESLKNKHTTLQTQFDNLYELANSGNDMNTEPTAGMK